MIKLLVKIILQFFFWKPKNWRKGLKATLESRLYSIAIRRRAKKCGRGLYILGAGVKVTANTVIGDGAGFGKRVNIRGDGPVVIGRRASIAEDTIIYTQVHDYDHSNVLPFGWDFSYPKTAIDDYAWIGLRSIILPGSHIGEGAIVQAGSVVMGNIPPCAIAAGNPAKVIGWRDIEHYNKLKATNGEKEVEIPHAPKSTAAAAVVQATVDTASVNPELAKVFCDIFSVTPDELPAMEYKQHPAWDSAGHMALISAIEQRFGISLVPAEIYTLRSYADACRIVSSSINNAASHRRNNTAFPAGSANGRTRPASSNTAPVFNLERDGIAVIDEGRAVSYRELALLAERATAEFEPHTVKIVLNKQDLNTVALFVGCIARSVVPLMLPDTIAPDLLEKLRTIYEGKPTAPDLAFLLTTSGSTGSPKLVRLSRNNLLADNKLTALHFELDESSRMTMILPICYAWGLSVACSVLSVGGTLVMTRRTVLDAELADVMRSAHATHLAGVPYMYEVLDRCRFFDNQLPDLRGLLISGGALAPALRRKFAEDARRRGIGFYEGYGQTEMTGVMSIVRTDVTPERIGSIGKADHGGRFRLDNGELVYEGDIVAMGYATCAEDLLKGDEWKGSKHTGDLATIDNEGYVTLTGRASRFIKIFGNRVSLQDVENLLKDHFPESGCAATGADNDLHVFVTAVGAENVERFLVTKLRFNTTVMKIHTLDEIPLNANGKTDYPKLKGLEKMAI